MKTKHQNNQFKHKTQTDCNSQYSVNKYKIYTVSQKKRVNFETVYRFKLGAFFLRHSVQQTAYSQNNTVGYTTVTDGPRDTRFSEYSVTSIDAGTDRTVQLLLLKILL